MAELVLVAKVKFQAVKILHIDTERGWRGGQNQVLNLMTALQDLGGVEQWVACEKSDALAQRAKPRFITIEGRWHQALSWLSSFWYLRQWLMQNPVDFLHAHSSGAHGIALLLVLSLGKKSQSKIIVHRRVDYAPSQNFFSKWKYQHHKIAHFICVSEYIRKVLLQFSLRSEQISVVHSAVVRPKHFREPQECAEIRRRLGSQFALPESHVWFLCVAAVTEQKGHRYLIEAVRHLKGLNPHFTVILAGDGPLLQECKDLGQELGVASHMKWLGHRNDIDDWIDACDVGLLSSVDEGLGSILLDFAWRSRAVCATSVGGIPELLENEASALLVPSKDPVAFSTAMKWLIDDPELRKRLGETARVRVEKKNSVESMAKSVLSIYQNLI